MICAVSEPVSFLPVFDVVLIVVALDGKMTNLLPNGTSDRLWCGLILKPGFHPAKTNQKTVIPTTAVTNSKLTTRRNSNLGNFAYFE